MLSGVPHLLSWNQVAGWLRQVHAVRTAALAFAFASVAGGAVLEADGVSRAPAQGQRSGIAANGPTRRVLSHVP